MLRYIHLGVGEGFYLRMLLMVVRGALSYADVRTYEGTVYNSFREACQARGLIGDDTEWLALFDEAVQWATSFQLRSLFITVLVYCDIGNVRALFNTYWRYMSDDLQYKIRKTVGNATYIVPENILLSTLLTELSNMFLKNGLSISSYDLPKPSESALDDGGNRLILEELAYDRSRFGCGNCVHVLGFEQRPASSIQHCLKKYSPTRIVRLFRSWPRGYRENIPVEDYFSEIKIA